MALPAVATADVLGPLGTSTPSAPSITTDKADYSPNSQVILTGSGWQPSEKVHIVVNDDGLQEPVWQHTAWVKADASGNITHAFDLPVWLVANYTVTATGQLSGTAYAAFTDAYIERGCGPVAATLVVDTTADDFDTEGEAGDCSLREAIYTSNENASVTNITVPAGTYTLTRVGTGEENDETGDLDVRASVSIDGAGSGTGAGATIVDGNSIDRVFHQLGVNPPIHLDFNDLTIRNGLANTAGGGIRAEDGSAANPNSLDLDNVLVTLNTLQGGNGGAGIYIVAANIDTTVKDSSIVDNDTAANCPGCDGGAIFNRGRSLDIDNSHLDNNSAGGKAGALWNTNGGQVTIDDSSLDDNTNNNAGTTDNDGFGGAIYQADPESLMTITNSTVDDNYAEGRGGGIYITNGHLVLDHSSVSNNELNAPRDGGGIFSSSNLEGGALGPAVQIIDSTIAGNTTDRKGGGYFDASDNNHDSLLIQRSTISGNTAATEGGGVRTQMDATIVNSTITNNSAGDAGGGLFSKDAVINLYNVTVSHNNVVDTASPPDDVGGDGIRRGGGAANDGVFHLRNTIVANNDTQDCSADTNANNPIGSAFDNVTNNLDSGTTCGFGAANGSLSSADPKLGPLQDNGGPTFTRAIGSLGNPSDALDAGNNAVCAAAPVDAIDQRHVRRPQLPGGTCDIGAYEVAMTVRGMKFNDIGKDGSKAGDPGLAGWVINAYLDGPDGGLGILSAAEAAAGPAASDTTDANGNYVLALAVDDYVICEELQPGWTQSAPTPPNTRCAAVPGAADSGYWEVDNVVGDDWTNRDFGNFASGAKVSGIKYDDTDENSVDDGAATDPRLDGFVINAYADDGAGGGTADNGVLDGTEAATIADTDTTDANGAYELTLAAGKYVICEELVDDWAQVTPANNACMAAADPVANGGHAVTVVDGVDVPGKDFGNTAGEVMGMKFDDANNSPLSGWVIKAFADDGSGNATGPAVATDTTASDGTYLLGLQPGNYVICEESQAGWTQTDPAAGPTTGTCPSGFEPVGYKVTIYYTSSLDPPFTGRDFGNIETPDKATVSGLKFDDENEDEFDDTDPADPPLQGWVINAYADDGNGAATGPVLATDTTDSLGEYSLELDPGDYVICEELQADWAQSYPADDPDDSECSGIPGLGPEGYAFTLAAGDEETADFGNYAGLVSGMKFDDANRDEDKTGDPGLGGWVINAYADDGAGDGEPGDGKLEDLEATAAEVATATTAPDGTYTLGLQVGDYVLCEELQAGWQQSTPDNTKCDEVAGAGRGGHAVTIADTQDDTIIDQDFGNFEGATVFGLKFDDQDRNGSNAVDPDDPPLEGWTIEAYEDDGNGAATGPVIASDETDADGNYRLLLPPGDFVICEVLQAGWVQSAPGGPTDCGPVSAADFGHAVTLVEGQEVVGKDFGNFRRAEITVKKHYADNTTMMPVQIELECTGGTIIGPNPQTVDPDGDPVGEWEVEGFAEGDSCSVKEVSGLPQGWVANTGDCEIDLEPGLDEECTVENVPEMTIVTNGGCTFDRETDRAGHQFPLILTPDTATTWKLSSTNPGQFFLNVVYDGDQYDDIDIEIPFPFTLSGTNPIRVFDDVNAGLNGSGKMCFHPKGPQLSSPSGSFSWNYGTNDFGDTKTLTVDSPQDGLVYVRIHLQYGLKGIAGACARLNTNPVSTKYVADCSKAPFDNDIGGMPTPDGYEQYLFTFMGDSGDGGGGQVESFNEFKKNPGIGSMALKTPSGDAVPFTNVEYWLGSTKMGTLPTDEDGWSMWNYKYTGKAATFTVKIPSYGLSKSVTMKSNGFVAVSFDIPEGAVPVTPGPTPTPTPSPTPTKPGGGKKN